MRDKQYRQRKELTYRLHLTHEYAAPCPQRKGKGLSKTASASGGSGGSLGAAQQRNAESKGSIWQRWRALLRGGDDPNTSAGQKNLKEVMGILPFFHGAA